MRASVFMDADQVSLAIGRGGHNINLAGKFLVMILMFIEIKIVLKMMLLLMSLQMKLKHG